MSHSRVPKAGRRSGLTQQGGATGGGDEALGGNNTRPRRSHGGDDADGSGDAPPRRQATGWGSPGDSTNNDTSGQAFGESSTGGGHGRPRAGRRAGGGRSGAGGAGAGSGGWTTAGDNNTTSSMQEAPSHKCVVCAVSCALCVGALRVRVRVCVGMAREQLRLRSVAPSRTHTC